MKPRLSTVCIVLKVSDFLKLVGLTKDDTMTVNTFGCVWLTLTNSIVSY